MLNGIMRIGVYGGTFAPIHRGHVAAAEAFLRQMELDLLYVIPTGIPPHKQVSASDDPIHRLRMCELAFAGRRDVIVSDMEIARGGKSYTVDTLRALAGEDRRLFLLTGTDMMLTLGQWRCAEEIFRLCYPVYIRRENDPILEARIVAKNKEYQEVFGRIVRRISMDAVEISSTEVRAAAGRGEALEAMVPEAVAGYIREHGLYV
ncbi:MAG: nicotinate (nicotinamide) nucleotide adenylyltransferase [Ruminococcaceae bacterium]|nr:nicotinate (nicotinamide) nucleotide adenylyltransferase [Oscillospiraceae bacterium]